MNIRFVALGLGCLLLVIQVVASAQTAVTAAAPSPSTSASIVRNFDRFDFPEPTAQSLEAARKLSLWGTYYHVFHATATNANGFPLLDTAGNSFGVSLTAYDWCMSGVEGTVQVTDSTGKVVTYNYGGRGKEIQVQCAQFFKPGSLIKPDAIGRTRWMLAKGPFGDGVQGQILAPFRTLAIDTTKFPIGTVFYIPGARGQQLTLPSGKVVKHDGYFFGADIGGAIKENHIDVFAGISTKNPFPTVVQNSSSKTFEAYIVTDDNVVDFLTRLHALVPPPPPRDTLGEALEALFKGTEVTLVVYDVQKNTVRRYNPDRARQRFSPFATYNIVNTLVGLESGALEDANTQMAWDKKKYPSFEGMPKEWTNNHTLRTAFKHAVAWYQREVARRVNEGKLKSALTAFGYGDADVSGGMYSTKMQEAFWFNSSLHISADEQVEFLRRFYTKQLPTNINTYNTVRDIMVSEETPRYKLSAVQGGGALATGKFLGWCVGFVETTPLIGEGKLYVFALNVETGNSITAQNKRGELTKNALQTLGILPKP
jgi:beta-lactamase class D/3D (Asp-Asp-Asp) domain-containing protein